MSETQFKNGGKPGPGRPKGAQAIVTRQLKEMILEALDNAGGVEYLEARANDPRTAGAFLSLVAKVLPMQITGENGGPVQHVAKIELVALK